MSASGQLKVNSCEFTWELRNFSEQCREVGDMISSPVFKSGSTTENSNEFQWKLELYPFGEDQDVESFLSIFLCNESQVDVDVCYKIILSDLNGAIIKWKKGSYFFQSEDSHGWFEFIKRDALLQNQDSLLDDVLNITCIIHMDMYSEEEMDIDKQILNNYESLLLNQNFSDLTIIVNDKHIKAHKSILSARSKVFAAMFNHNMKESNTNTVTITDVNYDIMEEMLLFVYSGNVKNLMKNAKDLLAAANKYEIMELVVLCEKSLCRNVKIVDACEILSIADMYNCSELKGGIIAFIIANIKEISNTSGFKNLIRSNPELFEEVFAKVVPLIVQKKQ